MNSLLIASGLVCTQTAAAQGSEAQGRTAISGTLRDRTGAAVTHAHIELDSDQGQVIAAADSASTGVFTLPAVAFGSYVLVIPSANGFAALTLSVQAAQGMAPLQVTLLPDTVNQTIDVSTGQQPSTAAADNKDAVTLTGSDLANLPVFDQDYITMLLPFLDPSSGASGGITIVVDGVEMKSAGVSPSAIQEVRINNDPYSAASNRPGRGRIEIMTKPGSPQFHGEFNFLIRDSALNAKNYFAPVKPLEHRRIYEGNFTGPAGHDGHTTFLVTGARREDDLSASIHAFGPLGLIEENAPTPARETEITGRIAHDRSDAHRISLQYNFDYNTSQNGNIGGLILPEAGYSHDGREDDLVFNDRFILSPNLLNQLQITLEKDEDVYRSATAAPAIKVNQSFTGGGAQNDYTFTEDTIHINDVVSYTHGRHYIRFGPQLPQLSRRAIDDHTNRLGTFGFSSLSTYTGHTPYVFTQQQGVGRSVFWFNELGTFVEDQIKLSQHLQVSLGLRFDWQTYLSDTNNIAPRLSAAYSPARLPRTVLRTGFGIFYDRTNGPTIASAKVHDGVALRSLQILNPIYPTPLPPGASLDTQPTSLIRFDEKIHTPYLMQYSVGVEHQVLHKLSVAAAYRGQVSVSLLRSRDVNAPPPPAFTSRPNPSFSSVDQFEAHGRGMLNALDLSMQGNLGRLFTGRAQYTLSRNENNTSGAVFFPQNQYAPNQEWGRADTDRLQRFNVIGTIYPGHWLTLGVAAALYSGAPYNEITGEDSFHTGLGNTRPAGVGRNTLQGGGTANLDLSWNHDFHLTRTIGDKAKLLNTGVSAFNLLNRSNFNNYIGSLGSQLFGQPTAALSPRQLQFNLRYSF